MNSQNYLTLENHPISSNCCVCIFKNITSRVEMEEKLQSTKKQYEMIFLNSPLGIMGEINSIINFINPKLLEMLEYNRKELIGRSSMQLIPENQESAIARQIRSLVDGSKDTVVIKTSMVTKAGDEIPVQMFSSLLPTDENPTVFTFVRDLTVEENLQNLLKFRHRLDMMNIFAAGITHDFNNLLSIIMINLELIETLVSDQNIRELVQQCFTATENAGKIINKLRNLSKSPENKKEKFDLYEIVQEVKEMIIVPDSIQLETEIGFESGKYYYFGDHSDFHQILMNLSLNSIQAMLKHQNHNRIWIDCKYEGDCLVIIHQDSGPGINTEFEKDMFRPFVSGQEKQTLPDNMGMGLTIVHQIITEKYNGTIQLDRTYQGGAKFIIRLPIL